MNRLLWPLAALIGVVGFLLGMVVARTDVSGQAPAAPKASAAPLVVQSVVGAATAAAPSVDFAAVAARLNASVVNVDAAVRGDARARAGSAWRPENDEPGVAREGTGSGFIIDPSGFILTNFHVVDGADRLTVTLGDGRAFRADIAGVDPALDIALIKIASPDPLPVAVLGDSGGLRVGQWVCAIGNPLGYVHSVTVGVVSFLGRKLFDQALDAYIQTDAAISLGNSGGPLIDANGRVVGITTAISSQAANIGFAVPISHVVAVLPQLREHGRVVRGFVGFGLTRITPTIERALALPVTRGALVQDVPSGTPADRAGLRPYDVVVAADGVEIVSDEQLVRHIANRAPGTVTSLEVLRGRERHQVSVKLAERPVPPSSQGRMRRSDALQASGREQGPLGLMVRDMDPASALRRSIPETIQGVAVVDVDPAGPARQARVRPGQVILEINRRPTPTAAQFQSVLGLLSSNAVAVVLIYDPITDQRSLVTIVPDRRE